MASTIPFRVVLTHNGVSRKFFTLFQGRDGSLYIHLYRPDEQPWRIPGTGETAPREMFLDFANFREPGFELHKISFHPTGYIHLTNRRGERYRDGTRGNAFAEMKSPHHLCVLVPCELKHLPVAGNEKGLVVDLVLPDDIGPFYATLALVKGDVSPEESRGNLLTPTFVLPLSNDGYKLTIVLRAVRNREGGTSNWPPFPFFLLRIAP